VRRRLLEGTLVEVSSSDNWWCVTAESIKKSRTNKSSSMKWKDIE